MNISDIRGSKTNGEYYYIRNVQGDIIGLADISGTQVVTYNYDTWGKLISIEGNQTVGLKNPYRYRGYRYDTETGLYYLNSRYYNPEWGRFINADAIAGSLGELLDHNLFVYCNNNIVNKADKSGYRPIEVVNLNEETKEMRKASLELMNPQVIINRNPVRGGAGYSDWSGIELGFLGKSVSFDNKPQVNKSNTIIGVNIIKGESALGVASGGNKYVGWSITGPKVATNVGASISTSGYEAGLYGKASAATIGGKVIIPIFGNEIILGVDGDIGTIGGGFVIEDGVKRIGGAKFGLGVDLIFEFNNKK